MPRPAIHECAHRMVKNPLYQCQRQALMLDPITNQRFCIHHDPHSAYRRKVFGELSGKQCSEFISLDHTGENYCWKHGGRKTSILQNREISSNKEDGRWLEDGNLCKSPEPINDVKKLEIRIPHYEPLDMYVEALQMKEFTTSQALPWPRHTRAPSAPRIMPKDSLDGEILLTNLTPGVGTVGDNSQSHIAAMYFVTSVSSSTMQP